VPAGDFVVGLSEKIAPDFDAPLEDFADYS